MTCLANGSLKLIVLHNTFYFDFCTTLLFYHDQHFMYLTLARIC
jgi:hypothetical protein